MRFTHFLSRGLALLLALPLLLAAATPAEFSERAPTPELLRQLRQGGFTLYLRHGLTENDRSDPWPLQDTADCSKQRVLSPAGRAQISRVGAALRERQIPLGEVFASPLCRTRDSAAAVAPGLRAVLDPQLAYVGNMTSAEKVPHTRRTRELLNRPVPAGTNRLVVGHGPNLMEMIGYFPAEGTLVVFAPGPDGPRYLASIHADAWRSLAP